MTKQEKKQEYESKQLLEELSKMPPMVIATAYLHAINYTLYGEDVTEKWLTATQNASALEKAYNEGYHDAMEQEPCDKCVYSTKDGYCQYDDITEAISPLEYILDKIKADIEEQIKRDFSFAENEEVKAPIHYGTANGLQVAIKIIDKYRKVTDMEIHCNCTDEEIAKSFIEDVEAVKDLLPRGESEEV